MIRASKDTGQSQPSYVRVPGGSLAMHDARTKNARQVELVPFMISRTPVTWLQYVSVLDHERLGTRVSSHPAHGLTWLDAIGWCNAASAAEGLTKAYILDGELPKWDVSSDGYRLPTEAEWERACRAGTKEPTYGPLHEIAWSKGDELTGPQPVARKNPNAYGLFDMLGNVWEWCWDYADTARYFDYRSLRGGGWADPPWSCRASVRRGSAPDAVIEDVGFRTVRGRVSPVDNEAGQGWSLEADRRRANTNAALPMGWTPLKSLLLP